jgi:hypothetical protein
MPMIGHATALAVPTLLVQHEGMTGAEIAGLAWLADFVKVSPQLGVGRQTQTEDVSRTS